MKHPSACLDVCRTLLEACYEKKEEMVAPAPLLNGSDLTNEMKMKPGREIGQLLEALRENKAMGNLAWALMDQGQLAEAGRLLRESLALKRRLYGEAHREIAADLNNLAYTLQSRRDFAGAEAAYREALAMNRRLLGDDHPEVAGNENNLAWLLHRKGDRAGAVALMRHVREAYRRGHPCSRPGSAKMPKFFSFAAP